jgi:hypothetical protein
LGGWNLSGRKLWNRFFGPGPKECTVSGTHLEIALGKFTLTQPDLTLTCPAVVPGVPSPNLSDTLRLVRGCAWVRRVQLPQLQQCSGKEEKKNCYCRATMSGWV